jgi:FdhD protein
LDGRISKLGKNIKIEKIKASSGKSYVIDTIPFELILTISLNGCDIVLISCSPAGLIELTIGYLANNNYIKDYSDINLLKICSHDINKIISRNDLALRIEVITGSGKKMIKAKDSPKFISSGCGNIDDLISEKGLNKIKSNIKVKSGTVLKLNKATINRQKYKKELGGLHSAALFDNCGNLLNMAEDIGRHNCIDKIAGHMLINKLIPRDKIIFTTGRLSIDLAYKICRMQVPVIVTNSSVSFSAVALAKKMCLTSIGYARSGRFNIYSCPRRIIR